MDNAAIDKEYYKFYRPDTPEYEKYKKEQESFLKVFKKNLSEGMINKYFELYKKRKFLKKTYEKLLHRYKFLLTLYFLALLSLTILAIGALFIGYQFFYLEQIEINSSIYIPVAIVSGSVVAIILLLSLLTWFIKTLIVWYYNSKGYKLVLQKLVELTKKYFIEHWARINHIFGPTGNGKDTLDAGIKSIIRDYLEDECLKILDDREKSLYMADLKYYRKVLLNDEEKVKEFMITDFDTLKEKVKEFVLKHPRVIGQRKEKKVRKIFNDWENLEKNQTYECKYIVDDGNKKIHIFDYLIDYTFYYIRYYYGKNFLFTNQPYFEIYDRKENFILPAKAFNVATMATIKEEPKKLKEDRPKNKKLMAYKQVVSIIPEMSYVSETEVDTVYSNADTTTRQTLINTGIHIYKPYQRHLNGRYYWHVTIGQKANRVDKLLRDQLHATTFAKQKTFICTEKKAIKKIDSKIEKLNILFDNGTISRRKRKKLSDLRNRRKSLANKGFIKIEIVNSTSSNGAMSAELHSLYEFFNDLKIKQYDHSLEVYFPADIYRFFNSWYLRAAKKKKEKEAAINFYNSKNWPYNHELTEEMVRYMGYNTADKFFDISDKDKYKDPYIYKLVYEPINPKLPMG